MFQTVLDLMEKFFIIGGGLWLLWGVVVFAVAIKDKNGPGLQKGIWQIVGGGMILGAATLFTNLIP